MNVKDLAALPAYQYQPLGQGNFRLIHLHPGRGDDEIQITIQSMSLGQGSFSAISYVWGRTDRIHKVFVADMKVARRDEEKKGTWFTCDDQPTGHIMITENLRKALLGLRAEDTYRVLWVDSLCINQDDPAEKSHQVKEMIRIFGMAQSTIVYLGQYDESMKQAFRVIDALASLHNVPDDTLLFDLLLILPFEVLFGPRPEWKQVCGTGRVSNWDAITALFELPWFRRIWVIQEVVLSRDIVVFAEQTPILWETLINACKVIERGRVHTDNFVWGEIDSLLTLERSRVATRASLDAVTKIPVVGNSSWLQEVLKANHFTNLLMQYRGYGATDPRDLLFALLGIASGHMMLLPEIDYSLSLTQIFTHTAVAWSRVTSDKPLSFLSCVDGSYNVKDLPTWVPDWRNPWMSRPIAMCSKWSPALSACKHLRMIQFPDPYLSIGEPVDGSHADPGTAMKAIENGMHRSCPNMPLFLKVRGLRLLTIKDVEPVKPSRAPHTWPALRHSQLINSFPEPYPTTFLSYRDAFVSTVQPSEDMQFAVNGPRSESFWSYRSRRTPHETLRPIFPKDIPEFRGQDLPLVAKYHAGPRSKPTIYVRASGGERGPNEPCYTQAELYNGLSPSIKLYTPYAHDGFVSSRVWFITEDGLMGLTRDCAEPGDLVVHLFGAATPHVLRKRRVEEGRTVWGYVGEAYVLGLMHGEAEDGFPEQLLEDFEME